MILAFVFVFSSHWHSRTLSTWSLWSPIFISSRMNLSPWAMYLSVSCPWGVIVWMVACWFSSVPGKAWLHYSRRLFFVQDSAGEDSVCPYVSLLPVLYLPHAIFHHWRPLYLGLQRKKMWSLESLSDNIKRTVVSFPYLSPVDIFPSRSPYFLIFLMSIFFDNTRLSDSFV